MSPGHNVRHALLNLELAARRLMATSRRWSLGSDGYTVQITEASFDELKKMTEEADEALHS